MILVLTKSFRQELKTTLENGKFGLIDASAA
jgi:hypothetical protein